MHLLLNYAVPLWLLNNGLSACWWRALMALGPVRYFQGNGVNKQCKDDPMCLTSDTISGWQDGGWQQQIRGCWNRKKGRLLHSAWDPRDRGVQLSVRHSVHPSSEQWVNIWYGVPTRRYDLSHWWLTKKITCNHHFADILFIYNRLSQFFYVKNTEGDSVERSHQLVTARDVIRHYYLSRTAP